MYRHVKFVALECFTSYHMTTLFQQHVHWAPSEIVGIKLLGMHELVYWTQHAIKIIHTNSVR